MFSIARWCPPERDAQVTTPLISGSRFQESLGCDGIEQPKHRLIRPVLRVLIDLRVAARLRRRVHALALTEVVPELLDLVGADVVGTAAAFRFRWDHFASSSSPFLVVGIGERLHAGRRLLLAPAPAVEEKAGQAAEGEPDEDDEP